MEINNLKPATKLLLNELVQDYKSGLPVNERVYNKEDNEALMYNLFRGSYSFSYKTFKELHDFLITS